jgi:hypothetical protein
MSWAVAVDEPVRQATALPLLNSYFIFGMPTDHLFCGQRSWPTYRLPMLPDAPSPNAKKWAMALRLCW